MSAAAPSPTAPAYRVEPGELPRDRETVLALWRSGLAHQGMPEAKFAWFYERNPEGPPDILLLRAGSEAVGVAAVGARRMRCGSRSFLAGALVDFVVVPDHRGLFPALLLQRRMRETGHSRFELLFGLPNAQSGAVVRRAGYRHAGDQVRSARVLRSSAYLARHLPRALSLVAGKLVDRARDLATSVRKRLGPQWRHAWLDRPDARFDALWQSAAAAGAMYGVRDREFLAWRFCECPYRRHRFLVLEAEDGRLVAYAACHATEEALHVSDFLCDPAVDGAARSLWLHLASEGYREGHRSLSVNFLGPPRDRNAMSAAGLVERERRPVYASFAGADPAGSGSSWYLTAADDDS
jgi:hypothetical protein